MTWVLEHSEARLSDRLVLLALANFAHDDGSMAFPAVATLAHKARLGRSTCQTSLRRLEKSGGIATVGIAQHGTTIYQVRMGVQNLGGAKIEGGQDLTGGSGSDRGQDLAKGGQNLALGGSGSGPNPSVNPSVPVSSTNAGVPERVTMRIGEKQVNPELWELTSQVLVEYNRQANSKLRLLTSAGQPSKAALRIYGRVREYPDITFEKHAAIIERTLGSRWWGSSAPGIGVVYGPNVFEDNITRSPTSNDSKEERDRSRLAAIQRVMAREEANDQG